MEKKTIDQAKVRSYIDHLQDQTHEKMMEHLKAFNEGVFAIIITILALEIPAPHSQAAYPAFIKSISIFLISFFVIGNFWYHLTLLLSNIKQAKFERVGQLSKQFRNLQQPKRLAFR